MDHESERRRQGHMVAAARKVVVYEFMSLDGVAENIASLFTERDDDEVDDGEVDAAGAAVIATQDAVILGRRACSSGHARNRPAHRRSRARSPSRGPAVRMSRRISRPC